jgi:hypothetical protein
MSIAFAVATRSRLGRIQEHARIRARESRVSRERGLIDEQAGDEGLECDDLLLARRRLREFRSPTGTGGGVEIHRVVHEALLGVREVDLPT